MKKIPNPKAGVLTRRRNDLIRRICRVAGFGPEKYLGLEEPFVELSLDVFPDTGLLVDYVEAPRVKWGTALFRYGGRSLGPAEDALQMAIDKFRCKSSFDEESVALLFRSPSATGPRQLTLYGSSVLEDMYRVYGGDGDMAGFHLPVTRLVFEMDGEVCHRVLLPAQAVPELWKLIG